MKLFFFLSRRGYKGISAPLSIRPTAAAMVSERASVMEVWFHLAIGQFVPCHAR